MMKYSVPLGMDKIDVLQTICFNFSNDASCLYFDLNIVSLCINVVRGFSIFDKFLMKLR